MSSEDSKDSEKKEKNSSESSETCSASKQKKKSKKKGRKKKASPRAESSKKRRKKSSSDKSGNLLGRLLRAKHQSLKPLAVWLKNMQALNRDHQGCGLGLLDRDVGALGVELSDA